MGARVIVCGGRRFANAEFLRMSLDWWDDERCFSEVIHGGCTGADRLAGDWATRKGIKTTVFLADWDAFGKGAGPIRNKEMLDYGADLVIAFIGGKGTQNMIDQATERGIEVQRCFGTARALGIDTSKEIAE